MMDSDENIATSTSSGVALPDDLLTQLSNLRKLMRMPNHGSSEVINVPAPWPSRPVGLNGTPDAVFLTPPLFNAIRVMPSRLMEESVANRPHYKGWRLRKKWSRRKQTYTSRPRPDIWKVGNTHPATIERIREAIRKDISRRMFEDFMGATVL